jgi:DNA polymerase-1
MVKKSSGEATKRLVLLDAHAIIHRAYHALPDFSSSKGEPTGALYGLSAMLIKIMTDLKPDFMAACFDLPGPTYRHDAYKEYKAGRAKADDALVVQLKRSRDVFSAFGVPTYSVPGFEADDMLGTIVEKLSNRSDVEIIIASGDMDTLQLVHSKRVRVYTLKKGISDTVTYDEDAVVARFGFSPLQIPDYKGLAGDPSDNIVGVSGIGDKTATLLIKVFGTIEGIYEVLAKKDGQERVVKEAKVTPRIAKLLVEHEEEARFSKMLATIRRDAPLEYSLPEKTFRDTLDIEKTTAFFTELEFRTLSARLRSALGLPPIGSTMTLGGDMTPSLAQPSSAPTPSEIEETALALWVVDSNMTDPSLEDMLAFGKTQDFAIARKEIFAELKKRDGEKVYQEIELPLIPIVHQMQEVGACIDRQYLEALRREYTDLVGGIEKRIYEFAGTTFNINSPKQLGAILFDTLGLGEGKRMKKTEGGARSTRESELAKIADTHPIIPAILEYRELAKLLSTYIEPLPTLTDESGRIHARFVQSGTTTGRMSSEQPNLQNIPIKTEHGRRIRRAFVAREGKVLLSVDYSQIELRIAAMLSGDEKLISIFTQGQDVHTAVAARVFGKAEGEVTKEERRAAKVINFGVMYGMGANALRQNLAQGGEVVTQKDAERYLDEYFKTFAGLSRFLDETKAQAARRGFTQTMFGRRRYFDGLSSHIPYIRAAAERMAINAPVQGTGADIVKIAMIRVDEMVKKEGLEEAIQLILQVHDELVFEVAKSDVGSVAQKIRAVMESVIPEELARGVRPVAEAKAGMNWDEMKPVV